MQKNTYSSFPTVARLWLRFRSFGLGSVFALFGVVALPASDGHDHSDSDEAMIEHFDEHLETFAAEIEGLTAKVDAIVATQASGQPIKGALKKLIEEWEHVAIHEVVEAKAIHLYPPIWQGIYAMEKAGEAADAVALAKAAEQTKSAFWQSLGGLRALAALPGKGAQAQTGLNAHSDHSGGQPHAGALSGLSRELVLQADDNMRFDKEHFTVPVGEPVTLRFTNVGQLPKEVMGHNVVVLQKGTPVAPFGMAAADAGENDYIPTDPEHAGAIVAHTELLGPGESATITFTLKEPGAYPYICSFVAHWRLMRGTIQAVPSPETDPVGAILYQLEQAVASYADGDAKQANDLVHGAYMQIFEGLEGDLIAQDADLVSQLELDFNAALPATFGPKGSIEQAREMLATMRARLLRAKQLLDEAAADRPSVF